MKNAFMHTPIARGSVGLGCGLIGLSHRPLPTKTSRLMNQSTGNYQSFCHCSRPPLSLLVLYVLVLSLTIVDSLQ
jgi:hypothetical protein